MEKVLLLLLHLFCHLSSTTHSVTSGETTTSTAPETTFTRAKCDDYKCVPSSSASNALVRFVHQETCPGRRLHFRMNILDERTGGHVKLRTMTQCRRWRALNNSRAGQLRTTNRDEPHHPTVVKCLSIFLKWGWMGESSCGIVAMN